MLTLQQIEAAAPDQPSLKAASKLMKPAKWPVRAVHEASGLIWGECQGSGANPYRVTADCNDLGAKCTCPSRKFPCKHALALMWIYAEATESFAPGEVPEWVTEWTGRRRKTTAQAPSKPPAPPRSARRPCAHGRCQGPDAGGAHRRAAHPVAGVALGAVAIRS